MIAKVLAVVALVCAVLAFFGVNVGDVSELQLLAVGLGSLAAAVLI